MSVNSTAPSAGECSSSTLSAAVLVEAAARWGTPLYVYDLETVKQRYLGLRHVLPPEVAIHYAFKANANLSVVRALAGLGSGAEVCSAAELELAVVAGFPADKIILTGPGKTVEDLKAAVRAEVGLVALESVGEARRLAAIAAAEARVQPVLLRIEPAEAATAGIELIRGAKFGVEEAAFIPAAQEIAGLRGLRFVGLHACAVSGARDVSSLLAHQERLIRLSSALADAGVLHSSLDFGGGLNVPYDRSESPLDLDAFGRGVTAILPARADGRYIIEPGRYLVAECGAYVMTVTDVKASGGRPVAIVDGGIHHLYRPRLTRANRLVEALAPHPGPARPTVLAGALPLPYDVFADDVLLPPLAPGDIVAIHRTGTYGFTHALTHFGLRASAAEVVLDQGALRLTRPRDDPRRLIAEQVALERRN
ncbi:hypothetical protein WMF31_21510 [Sorangium sp. So ce1036]|uniref:diaminopimelate decarboxylase family protein n=1 Tax=Sorangium sp. So ce1036 TaxID=3133328 RepID=UPI003EFD3AF9